MSTSQNPQSGETITPQDSLPQGSLWIPMQGPETHDLLTHLRLDQDSTERIAQEATHILSKCAPPASIAQSTTGLVLGYVQSGKTLSFTTVAALARDNGYPLIIVITGVSNPLFDQSNRRLDQDLRLQSSRKWRLFRNPKADDHQSVADVLADWRNDRLADHRRRTVLITVLKNTTHLRNLNRMLATLDLRSMPVLVIDDEADQAGLNTAVSTGNQSTTYQRLVALRQAIPHHSYLQYTATPQAPLLINIIDVLSPQFVELLTPGDDYVGGAAFFEQQPNLVRVIPPTEIPSRTNVLQDVPDTLIQALRLFFLGVAAGFVTQDDQQPGRRNRSMLVHPSRETVRHGQFFHWITQVRRQWLELLNLPQDNPERIDFVREFEPAYNDLRATEPSIPEFGLLAEELSYSILKTEVLEVNARPQTPQPNWNNSYPWILVGGQAMDRGFTVEGLTVTYMPRDMGVGNADTIEQRARFFGYKRRYLGYCRVFLEQSVRDAFQYYVEHERDIRERLGQHRSEGRPLSEWRRAFFLDSSLRPTRRQVLNLDYKQDTVSEDWFWPKVPHGTPEILDANRALVREFLAGLQLADAPGDSRRTPEQIHLMADGVSLQTAYQRLLSPLRLTDERDSQIFTGLLLQIEAYLADLEHPEHRNETCSVYLMSRGNERMRSVNAEEEIPTLFQGANYADTAHRDMIYPGDERERTDSGLTIQIHMLEVREPSRGPVIANNVLAIAVWVPQAMAKDWLVQRRT
jgi:hypothetical protein